MKLLKWLSAITLVCAIQLRGDDLENARKLIDAGKVQEALQQLRTLQEARPGDTVLQLEIGQLLQELAASRVERLRQAAPDSAQAHELSGKVLEAHQRTSDALKEYKLAAGKSPHLPGVHFLIGNLYWKQGELTAAKTALEQELALNANHSLANLRMGQVLLRMDETRADAAIPFLRKAIDNPQTSLQAHRELGKALRLSGKPQEAILELKYVAQRVPDDNMIHAQLAAAYRAAGDAAAARREMEQHSKILQAEHERLAQLWRKSNKK
jgi:tetratricopeptide (TPR) repeat protein